MTTDLAHIFVYGTLRAESDHPMARRLCAQARHVGKGTVCGLLFDCGWYPAALFNVSEKRRILGDVFALKPGERLLADLDAYEAGDPNYARAPLEVSMLEGGVITAWAYGVAVPPNMRIIPGGDFISHMNKKSPRPIRS